MAERVNPVGAVAGTREALQRRPPSSEKSRSQLEGEEGHAMTTGGVPEADPMPIKINSRIRRGAEAMRRFPLLSGVQAGHVFQDIPELPFGEEIGHV